MTEKIDTKKETIIIDHKIDQIKPKKPIRKEREGKVQPSRLWSQFAFALISIWIGVEFYYFTQYFETGGSAGSFYRPPGVDAFLPISSMMSVYYFALTGDLHQAHPAGFFIFLGILSLSFVLGKSFCSWVCPVGTISEAIGDFGEAIWLKIFKRKPTLPRWLDYPLRSIKYLLLGFLFIAVFFSMGAVALKAFLDSPYNIISDVKMYYFFADISQFALIVIAVLFLLSVFIRSFWCRYLCPYGAFLGVVSLFSPLKIKRNTEKCTSCHLCTIACPSRINVENVKKYVISDECTSCLKCVDACPLRDTLYVENIITKKKVKKKAITPLVFGTFFLFVGLGIVTGNWQNKVTKEEYEVYIEMKNSLRASDGGSIEKGTGDNGAAKPRSERKGAG
ncbi:MAG: ferredoxin [Ignavibacteriales bacterium UTCHB3]|nr:MAG: ferredoxin [Ignavibacteriales bacterium UTCHB3]